MKTRLAIVTLAVAGVCTSLVGVKTVQAEAMIQYFNTSWKELTAKIPELAEVGYNSIWLPPPQKGSGGLSVGYDHWDPFDFGSIDQRGTVRTRYGTEAELLHLIEVAHRFGIRIYFDNIMNHRAFDVPGFNETTPLEVYPGMWPEDFHLRVTADGFYRKWDNTRDWNDAWQVLNLGLADLIDIAHETPNTNFGTNEGDDHPKIVLTRQPGHPEWYLDTDLPLPASNSVSQIGFTVYSFANKEPYTDSGWTTNGIDYVGAGNGRFDWQDLDADGQHDAGEPAEPFDDTGLDPTRPGWQTTVYGYGDGVYNMGNPGPEDVGGYLVRAVRWTMDHTHVDGLRLDAVKHVPDYFFGKFGDDVSSDGYCGQAQMQFNITRGFSDWDNHRDSVFDTERGRDDAMMFGEHLGEPPGYGGYFSAGMRLVDNPLRNHLNGVLGSPWSGLNGLDSPGAGGFSPNVGVMHAQSHDNDYASVRELQHAFYFSRAGLPLVYTDGNYQSETLGESGGAFPRHANTAFLGQFGDNRLPNMMYIHNHFARADQVGKWSDGDVVAYERRDKRENGGMDDASGTVMAFMMNDNTADGQYRDIPTTFPEGSYLWNYADRFGRQDNGFYHTVQNGTISVIIPAGGYFAFSWRTPEPADAWNNGGGRTLAILEDGRETGFVSYQRNDGPDGDPGFNPYGVADTNAADFAYTWYVPRVTSGTNVSVEVRTDGSAENVLLKLDGGMDLNGINHPGGDPRDNPPALSTDVFLGYEQMSYVQRTTERFAAADISRNVIGSPGAETYHVIIGTGSSIVEGSNPNDIGAGATATWLFHNPSSPVSTNIDVTSNMFFPDPPFAADQNIFIWVEIGYSFEYDTAYIYYTTNGTNPEGAGGHGLGSTQAKAMSFAENDGSKDWLSVSLPAMPAGTELRYKISAARTNSPSRFPTGPHNAFWKKQMVTHFQLTNLNLEAVSYRPHGDYGKTATGLEDGFHLLSARAFLKRDGMASLYNTFPQTFYLDLETPQGEIVFPQENDTIGSQEYGAVVRTDRTVNEVLFHIDDNDDANDDANTGINNGNGLDTNGVPAWAPAYPVNPTSAIRSDYPEEWRYSLRNVPADGQITNLVRLLEISSTTNNGHFTTLTRHVWADGPDASLFVAYPQQDGDVVDPNYVMKVYFSKSMGDGLSDQELIDRFLIRIDDVAQGRQGYQVTRDIFDGAYPPGDWHELSFTFPDLYNGNPNFLHLVEVTYTTPGNVQYQASRLVKAREADRGPHIEIIEPREVDSDGRPTVIVLPDVASPAPEDRQITIRVETDLASKYVWIDFETNGFAAGGARAVESIETRLSGTFSATQGSTAISAAPRPLTGTVGVSTNSTGMTGSGTLFSNELRIGHVVGIDTNSSLVITQILSDTSAYLNTLYPGPDTSGVAAAIQPLLLSEVSTSDTVRIDTNTLELSSVLSNTGAVSATAYPGPTVSGAEAYRLDGNPIVQGTQKIWVFLWTNMTAGSFRFYAHANTNAPNNSEIHASATRNVQVVLRQVVESDPNDLDDDDDGILDLQEQNAFNLPPTNPETWTNFEVLAWQQFGRSQYLGPDTDNDLLPDGLEIGLRAKEIDPVHTDVTVDTNGDGITNFVSDLDPPFFNTVPDNGCGQQPGPQYCLDNAPTPYNFSGSRTTRLGGSTTDPLNPDSDYDGLRDGVEDANQNGWLDGDGDPLPPYYDNPKFTEPGATPRTWPDGARQSGETWLETDPNNPDTDGDFAGDGYGEDYDLNGSILGDTNFNRVYESPEEWGETDPLNPDTDGDGLPDGWENQYQFDPLDNGTNSLRFSASSTDGLVVNGAEGNPDNDFIVIGIVTQAYVNILEYQNGTNPRSPDTGEPPPDGTLVIGPGEPLAGQSVYYQEFMDWFSSDCVVLDEYEGGGNNNQQGDVFLAYDGFDTSRDIIGFYARDGGASGQGGDDRFYFRLDFFDLQALAEEGHLDFYIVVDTGQPGSGERLLPEELDTLTDMRWELVVAAYQSNLGTVYVDLDTDQNTTGFGEDLFGFGGVVGRGHDDPAGFLASYYNSDLDAVELAISRQALFDAGWSGDADALNFQVFTTRDGTCNSCNNGGAGAGDRGGETDIRDTIFDDWLAEDNFFAKQGIQPILRSWIPGAFTCGQAKFTTLVHGNQAGLPGSDVQDLVNNGAGAGYHRPVEIHETFGQPLSLHVTPTLASAMEWARVDPAFTNDLFRDGPALNDRIARLVATNLVDLVGSTFSDHILPYFTPDYNRDNERLARAFLENIYDTTIDTSRAMFWIPERVADSDVFSKVLDMGYTNVVIDQALHMRKWFGRETALGNDGYRINRIHGVNCFVMNEQAVAFRFDNADRGLSHPMRGLFVDKALNGEQQQVVTIFSNWEDFTDLARANAYDANIRWIANHQWIRTLTHQQIMEGEAGGPWWIIDRGSPTSVAQKVAHDFIHHSTEENYDNWYLGSEQEEGLFTNKFTVRPGVSVPTEYGMLYNGGIVSQAWDAVSSVLDTNLAKLAGSALHASTFQTAFHDEDNFDLSKFSIGTYIYPDESFDALAGFARNAQAQSREAYVYQVVDAWAEGAWMGFYEASVVTTNVDVDLDGEDEYVIYNDRVFAACEAMGGRMTAAWVRDLLTHQVYQTMGALAGYAGLESEEEGTSNADVEGNVVAYRTSGLKDWFSTKGGGTSQYVNDVYSVTPVPGGWQFVSPDGHITKTVTLAPRSWAFEVSYTLDSADSLYVRHGFSPDLFDLLLNGQETLGSEQHGSGTMWLANTSYVETVQAVVGYGDAGHDTSFNLAAVDDNPGAGVNFYTLNMRNQAQTHQVEVFGTESFSFSLGFRAELSDWDGDGMPNVYEDQMGFDPLAAADGEEDEDGDGVSNSDEFIAGTDPRVATGADDYPQVDGFGAPDPSGLELRIPTKPQRWYYVYYSDREISDANWALATSNHIDGTGSVETWLDDGTETDPHPFEGTNRTYRIDVTLPR